MAKKPCTCGKQTHANRKSAMAALRAQPDRRVMAVYPCPNNKRIFHIGHRGRMSALLRLERAARKGGF